VLLERPWDDQSSTAKQELTTQSVLDRSSNINVGQMITNALRDTETKEGKLHRLLESQLKKWQDGMEFQEKTRYHETIQQRIAFWNQDLEAALEGFISLRRILEDFLKKPAL
jgi:predicted acetyltransferase